jgi:hypothetical protein
MRRIRVRNANAVDNGLYVPAEDLPAIREEAARRALVHAGYVGGALEAMLEELRGVVAPEVSSVTKTREELLKAEGLSATIDAVTAFEVGRRSVGNELARLEAKLNERSEENSLLWARLNELRLAASRTIL